MNDLDMMKLHDRDEFRDLVRMHLSFLVNVAFHHDEDAGRNESESGTKHHGGLGCGKQGGVMDGAKLTEEGVCQIYQIIQFLEQPQQIVTEGIFRKHGNLKKQQVLKQMLNQGAVINLDDGEFSVHECASVLKGFLQELPEPLLTDAHFEAHTQVAQMGAQNRLRQKKHQEKAASGGSVTAGVAEQLQYKLQQHKQLHSLQLLMLLLPDPNYNILKDLLLFLHKVAENSERNKMNALNLGTLFAAHLMCPREMSSEELQVNHGLYAEAVAFIIEKAPALFDRNKPPPKLLEDIKLFNARKCATPKIDRHLSASSFVTPSATTPKRLSKKSLARTPATPGTPTSGAINDDTSSSPVVNTIFSFVDHTKSREIATSQNTETALAELYAQVQSMPESAKKKRLIKQFNEANGCGTPKAAKNSSQGEAGAKSVGHKLKMPGKEIFNWVVPKAAKATVKHVEGKKSGSYNLKASESAARGTIRNHAAEDATTPTFILRKSTSSCSDDEAILAGCTPVKTLKPVNLIVTPSTPKAENQNNLYCKNSAQIAYSAMVDECDSMAETKQLGVGPSSSSTTLSPSSSSSKSSEDSSDNEAMLLQQIHHIKTPKPEYKSSDKENFV